MQNKAQLLQALETEKNGDWDSAHATVQKIEDPNAYRIHAYLHRKEGDLSNAGYWYQRAGKDPSNLSLDEEWQELFEYMNGL